ncbi:MAG: acylneuraminate cytidylyltransferase family protein [Gammaproteobacteria bacterium]|nr:acylneuraminate cytidylyltransferase family protein [Gammaproteobacteria bacterium]MBU2058389.1 acylneuraminate cytidylyltransferase family protein [Gammaproteobacteria bacterium]MBU2176558.1 acylneuraminate cytidylyltransferase family protein [Gammaproteobacteria bacterium]MBU2248500.1 acylneuraminate cytidylyltransferase family protein [Gammaproteobacteria bacterium]MBU2345637.1 acylneuraminate cytidylyltransferase family protein [Gammaproteobacteria bacterium]
MISDKTTLAIIPARAGSKRLPRKNILPLAGKPLICWTVESALAARGIDQLVVSTDDAEVVRAVAPYQSVVCLERPADLATDTANSMDVLFQVLDTLEHNGQEYDRVIWLQATSPLRQAIDIEAALSLYDEKQAKAVVSVTTCEHSPLWSNTLPDNGSMSQFIRPEVLGLRSQDLPEYYRLNGALYIADVQLLKQHRTFFQIPGCYAYIMSALNSVDIDQQLDFDFAQFLIEKNQKGHV